MVERKTRRNGLGQRGDELGRKPVAETGVGSVPDRKRLSAAPAGSDDRQTPRRVDQIARKHVASVAVLSGLAPFGIPVRAQPAIPGRSFPEGVENRNARLSGEPVQRLTAFPAAVEIETARLRMKLPPRKTVAAPADSVPGENPQKSAERGGVEAFPAVQRKIHRKILLGDSGVRLTGHDRRTNPERRELQIIITGLPRRRHRKNPLLRIEGSGSRRHFVSAVIEAAIAQLLRRKLFLAGQNRQPERRGIPRRNKMLLRRRRPAGDHALRLRNAGQPDVPDLGESRIGPEPVGMNQDADRLQRRRERFPAVLRGGRHREANLLEIRIAAAQLRRMFMNPAGRILKPDGDPRRSRPDLEPELFGIRIIHGESNGGVTAAERKIPIQPQHTVPAVSPPRLPRKIRANRHRTPRPDCRPKAQSSPPRPFRPPRSAAHTPQEKKPISSAAALPN